MHSTTFDMISELDIAIQEIPLNHDLSRSVSISAFLFACIVATILFGCKEEKTTPSDPNRRTLIIEKGSDKMKDKGVPWISTRSVASETRLGKDAKGEHFLWKLDTIEYSPKSMGENPMIQAMTRMATEMVVRFYVDTRGTSRVENYASVVADSRKVMDMILKELPDSMGPGAAQMMSAMMEKMMSDTATYSAKILDPISRIHGIEATSLDTVERCAPFSMPVEMFGTQVTSTFCGKMNRSGDTLRYVSTGDTAQLRRFYAASIKSSIMMLPASDRRDTVLNSSELLNPTITVVEQGAYAFDKATKQVKSLEITLTTAAGSKTILERTSVKVRRENGF